MARKRGGLAGLYDRNKGIIRTLASMGAGAVGGPLAGAAVGAAFRGLDREGKSGIGFDPFAALPGAVEGYMAGQTGQAVKGGIKGLLAPRMAERAGTKGLAAGTKALEGFQVPDLADYNNMPNVGLRQRGIFEGLTGEGGAPVTSRLTTAAAPKVATRTAARAAASAIPSSSAVSMPAPQTGIGFQFPGMGDVGQSAYGGAPSFTPQSFRPGLPSSPLGGMPSAQPGPLSFMRGIGEEVPGMNTPPKKPNQFIQALLNPQVLGAGVQGLLSMLPDAKSAAMEEQTKLGQGQLALQQAQFEEEKRRADMEQERKRRIAELLMPYIQQQYGSYFGGR